jgi:hypothetical protein
MNIAEILRKLADTVDGVESADRPTNSVQHAELAPVEVDTTDNTESSTQIPPLQAKLELLKKSMGMDNAYDEATPCDSAEDAELALIKQRAGVPVIAVQEMADDEPTEG